jgi:hypothetical protein
MEPKKKKKILEDIWDDDEEVKPEYEEEVSDNYY